MKKKKRLKVNRVIIAVILVLAIVFGLYQSSKVLINYIASFFISDSFISEVNGPTKGTVVLDAGHGLNDVGAQNNGIYEKDINLEYTREIGNYLMKHGVNVIYTRKTDARLADNQNEDLRERCQVGKGKADYYISIHVNSIEGNKDVKGFEIYYLNNDEKSYNLANHVNEEMESLNYTHNRGVLEGNSLYVIRNNTVTPILIELGYIKGDFESLTDHYHKVKLSQKIAEGIIKTIENEE